MTSTEKAKPATAETVNGLRKVEQLGGGLNLKNTLSDDISQPETAMSAALREAARRKAGARSPNSHGGIGR
jgi:hypothetical protein